MELRKLNGNKCNLQFNIGTGDDCLKVIIKSDGFGIGVTIHPKILKF